MSTPLSTSNMLCFMLFPYQCSVYRQETSMLYEKLLLSLLSCKNVCFPEKFMITSKKTCKHSTLKLILSHFVDVLLKTASSH